MTSPNDSGRSLSRLIETTEAATAARLASPLPSETKVVRAVNNMREILFPGSVGHLQESTEESSVRLLIGETLELLEDVLTNVLQIHPDPRATASALAHATLEEFPNLRDILMEDAAAALRGDPAALDTDNVILNYPGFRAVTVQRIAHLLHDFGALLVPRQMTEYMHRETGIDIHPGATIGKGFFIDHGTGVVIGETTEIGDNVRLYQGVTLGAAIDPVKAGRTKRHPTLEDNVTCFANSGVFGPVVIGKNSIIGANADIFDDMKPNTIALAPKPELRIVQKRARTQ